MTKSYAELQFEKIERAFDLMGVMQQTADDLGIAFDELSNLTDIPHNRPEFADYTRSLDCRLTYFEPINNNSWYEVEESGVSTKTKKIQSFQVFDIVLFRPSIESEETVWLTLNNLQCSAVNSDLINDLFQQAWKNKTEVNTATLRNLIDFSTLKHDTVLEWRRAMRGRNTNTYNLAVKMLDEVWQLPKQIISMQKKLSNLVKILNTIRPQNHLLEPLNQLSSKPNREDTPYARGNSDAEDFRSRNAATRSTNHQQTAAN